MGVVDFMELDKRVVPVLTAAVSQGISAASHTFSSHSPNSWDVHTLSRFAESCLISIPNKVDALPILH